MTSLIYKMTGQTPPNAAAQPAPQNYPQPFEGEERQVKPCYACDEQKAIRAAKKGGKKSGKKGGCGK